ncbi:MAG: helix-turn-helix transcriptional regulator [Clostridia bacterium]|nr:helix-turn-helix transcriptional regulator [Clostridia bacterium]
MQEDNFNDSQRNDPYEIKEDNDGTELSVSDSSAATGEVQPDDKAETAEPSENAKGNETNSISSDLIRGHINTIILRALYERDKYGYEIMDDIEQKSHGQYSLKQPTLYSALKRLENQGYLKAYWKTDEVSNGGRRKYFTLTENGKEITDKNLAEWEYSRTIIDSLISDKSFDFSQPAPTPVDFTILRNSVSRVPVIKNGEGEKTESASEEYRKAIENTTPTPEAQPTAQTDVAQSPITEQTAPAQTQPSEQFTIVQVAEQPIQSPPVTEQPAYVVPEVQPSVVQEQSIVTEQHPSTSQTVTFAAEQAAQAEARRVAHENYLRLISEPVRQPEPQVDNIVPNSENVDTDKLIYNNRPETERDYKNLIDGIFRKAVSNGSVQTNYYVPPQPKPAEPEPKRVRLVDRGRADGVAVATSSNFDINSTYATKTTYNKGLTLLKCSSIVLAVTVLEFIFCFIFLNQLKTTWVYPVMILLLGLAQFTVFGIMTLQGYGKNCVRPTTNSYISSSIILTIIAILIISALSFLLNVNPTSVSDVMKMLVIPSVTALNITLFAICFKLFIK